MKIDLLQVVKTHPYMTAYGAGMLLTANAAGNLTESSNIMWLIIGCAIVFGAFAAYESRND